MTWLLYGRRPGEKRFRALDGQGRQVQVLADAFEYCDREDAEYILKRVHELNPDNKNEFQIRPVPKTKRTVKKSEL